MAVLKPVNYQQDFLGFEVSVRESVRVREQLDPNLPPTFVNSLNFFRPTAPELLSDGVRGFLAMVDWVCMNSPNFYPNHSISKSLHCQITTSLYLTKEHA